MALKKTLYNLIDLFITPSCKVCGSNLSDGEDFICVACRWQLPLVDMEDEADSLKNIFAGNLPVNKVFSYFHYSPGGNFRKLIHDMKYRGNWKNAYMLGLWLGETIKGPARESGIDIIVPVPLHLKRRLRRGYNQSEYFARGLSEATGIPYETGNLVRTKYNKSQTTKTEKERWENVEGIFKVKRPEHYDNKHILLVDDILTTGATLISCGDEILRSGTNCRLSIATMAVTSNKL